MSRVGMGKCRLYFVTRTEDVEAWGSTQLVDESVPLTRALGWAEVEPNAKQKEDR